MPKFSKTLNAKAFSGGLRPSKRVPRDAGFLTESYGVVGRDGVLSVLDEVTRLATDTISDGFPYPQIFVFSKCIIVCGLTKIYEWDSGVLSEKLTVMAGTTWRAVDYHDFVYMSNGKVSVERSPNTKTYALSSQPIASAMCDYNGQCLIGAPDVEAA